jgi:hypothetical protein
MRRFVMFSAVVSVIVLTAAGVDASNNQSTVPVATAVGLCNKHGGMKNGGCSFDTGKELVNVDCNGKSGCVVNVSSARTVSHPNKKPTSGGTMAR